MRHQREGIIISLDTETDRSPSTTMNRKRELHLVSSCLNSIQYFNRNVLPSNHKEEVCVIEGSEGP